MEGFSWESVAEQKATDNWNKAETSRNRGAEAPPNQYTLPDGRVVDAETCLYRPSVREEG